MEESNEVGKQNRRLIIDDLADELEGTNELNKLFLKQSHHLNVSVIFVTHNLLQKNSHQVSLNCHYMFLFYNPRDVSIVQT